jgi:formylglycine-generating enzyme required for sulfatase activity
MRSATFITPSSSSAALHYSLVNFVRVAAGRFTMGRADGHPAERPVHEVWLEAFEIATTPVTNAQWAAWLAATGERPPAAPRFSAPPPVGSTPANPLGLHDLAGVCHEWCADWYDEGYYAVAPPRDPRGPATGTRRVSRGGAWRHADPWSPVAHRSSLPPHRRYSDYGVRLARSCGTMAPETSA